MVITGAFRDVGFATPPQHRLQLWNGVGKDRRMVPPLNRKAERSIEWRQVALTKTLSLTLPKTNTGDTQRVVHLIVEWDGVAPDVQPVG